jgi:hypothetical protein
MTSEPSGASSARSIIRIVVVVALSTFILGSTIPNIWDNSVNLPLSTDPHYKVTGVFGDQTGGIRVGDVVDVAACDFACRLIVDGFYFPEPGQLIKIPMLRNGGRFDAAFRLAAQPSVVLMSALKRTAATVFVIVAALLLLRRPTRMLWGFFLFAIGSVNGTNLFFERFLPAPVWYAQFETMAYIYAVCAPLGLWMFAARFPRDQASGWRRYVDAAVAPMFLVLSIAQALLVINSFGDYPSLGDYYALVSVIWLTIGLLCFVDAYLHLRADERQRLKWVMGGMAIAYAGIGYQGLAAFLPGGGWPASWMAAGWTPDVLSCLQIFIPATVAYAVLRHRVLDVNFFVSRALVYGALTSIIIAVFALVDWFFTKAVAERQVAATAEIIAALALGFGLNGMHRFVDAAIDRIFFRHRHAAERRLGRATAGLQHVTDTTAVDDALVCEPVESLGLTSAAVFRRDDDGAFARTKAIGWNEACTASMTENDPLVQNLHGERDIVRLREIRKSEADLPAGVTAPAIAVPLFVRHALEGFALFGAHSTGEDFDSEELALIRQLAQAAAATYDHLDAERARKQTEMLARKLDDTMRALSALRPEASPAS